MVLQRDIPISHFSFTPLHLQKWYDIPKISLKNLPLFYGNGYQYPIDHIQDITNHCVIQNIKEETIHLSLLVSYFRGREKYYYNILSSRSISTWDNLGEQLDNQFKDNVDIISLMEHIRKI